MIDPRRIMGELYRIQTEKEKSNGYTFFVTLRMMHHYQLFDENWSKLIGNEMVTNLQNAIMQGCFLTYLRNNLPYKFSPGNEWTPPIYGEKVIVVDLKD